MKTAPRAAAWMASRGWTPFDFQREVWAAQADGRSGLLHATTGAGKTYAVWLGLLDALAPGTATAPPLTVLWITPMRALAADTVRALQIPLQEMAPAWALGLRTGDTPSAERARQDRRLPSALVTTPESLSLLLSRADAPQRLAGVRAVVVDEWHELIGSKRGVQVQLALARLRRWQPALRVWGMSATLGNLDEARQVLCGDAPSVLVRGVVDKALTIDTLIPDDPGRYSWAGHLGARMQAPVARELDSASTALVFTNTRSQAEMWYQLLLAQRPDWAGQVALHHGSLDPEVRGWVEQGLKAGSLKAVVATSSLDLGVDFLPVERVLQIGSAKGIARLLQRAGRSGHAPGRPSRITLVPTNTLELVEAAAAREAALAGRIESRHSPEQPLDVLVQHLVTVALGGGFHADDLFSEVRTTWAYRSLPREAFDWALVFCERGGDSLRAYPDYHRIARDAEDRWTVPDSPQGRATARRHRLGVGTIVSDASLQVRFLNGSRIGHIEEGFIARLRKGDAFVFAGRLLEFVRVQDMTAWVKLATRRKGTVPTWQGGKMPLSSELADAVLRAFDQAGRGVFDSPELRAAAPMLQTQAARSCLPGPGRLVIERLRTREGHHVCLYPFAGRQVHLGLAGLLAWRLSREQPNTFSLSVNDYGIELLAAEPPDVAPLVDGRAFDETDLIGHVMASLNAGELAQRRFREIARIAGLVFSGYPGAPKSLKQLQASSGLFFEVFRKHDPHNRLLGQAEREVLSQELDAERLRECLARLSTHERVLVDLEAPSPMGLPLIVERLRERLSTEQLEQRLERLLRDLEKA
ncbi:ligase-associated DNA damage response DEXH box helicase [Hydrogenophaga sp. XSHU_21]